MSQIHWTTIKSLADAPTTAGVYMYMAGRKILYIGKAVSLRARLKSHAQNAKLDAKERAIVQGADKIKYTETDTEFAALLLEASLIQKHLPPYNRALRDDKSYLYIVIDMSDPYPKPRLVRARDLKIPIPERVIRQFGPFPSTKLAEEVLRTIRRLIPFCQQPSVGTRACFYSHIGLCSPCPSLVAKIPIPERNILTKQYRQQIKQIIRILEGKINPVISDLRKQLQGYSKTQNFEGALELRDKISRFELAISTHSFSDRRILELSSADSDLQNLHQLIIDNCHLDITLKRVEGFDASTFQLHHSVVSMVVATDGHLDHGQYRRFRIKNPRVNNDFDMLKEALGRRLKNSRWPRPDLIVIDGGRPQLRRLQPLLDQLENPLLMVGLAKHPDKLIIPNLQGQALQGSNYITISLDPYPGALHLLQRLRDEAHRFANKYRQILENKQKQL